MRPIFDKQPTPEKRVDFGDAVISNANYDCNKCLLKAEGCKFVCNSINCTVAIKRMRKILDEREDKVRYSQPNKEARVDNDDAELKEEEQQSLKDYLSSLSSESSDEEEDDD